MLWGFTWFCAALILNIVSADEPLVSIKQGTLKGLYIRTLKNRRIASFEGIPYSIPPVGQFRFKPAVPAGPWHGVLKATREPPKCLQGDWASQPPRVIITGSEDCLYLNVYTPQLPADSNGKLYDVIAFIHGGAYFAGFSKTHDPFLLLDRDILLVTFNYRLGPLGFLSTGDSILPGNDGMKDQVLALKWIQENIAAFGGNPRSVTLVGHSAGAACAHYHTLSPLSRGLFKGLMSISGVALNPWALAENIKEKTKLIGDELGCPTNDSNLMISCLRSRPAEHIVAISPKFTYGNALPVVIYAPIVEPESPEAFISDEPINIIISKNASDIPSVVSFTSGEGLIVGADFILDSKKFNELLDDWEEYAPHLLDYNYTVSPEEKNKISRKIKEHYKIEKNDQGRRNLIKLISDRLFISDIGKLVEVSSSLYSSPIYAYKFSYKGELSIFDDNIEEIYGVSHVDDIFYTLRHYRGREEVVKTKTDLKMSEKMLDLWASFAANGTLGENWKPTNQQSGKFLYTEMVSPEDFRLIEADGLGEKNFWNSLGLNENIVSKRIRDEF